uniref:Uncharacterized protein n=1 Tax=Cacopsylla melanoneura TaxID=428564 RepID=A0A8D8SR44_9HEMI
MDPDKYAIEAFEKYFVQAMSDSQYKGDLLENLRKQLTELESKETHYDKLDEEFKAELKEAKETNAEMKRIDLAWKEEKQGLNEELGKLQVAHNILCKINEHFKVKNNLLKSEIGLLETEKKQLELNLCTKGIKKLTLKTKLTHLKTDLNNVTRQMEASDRTRTGGEITRDIC